jgi:hypothetical protein
MTPPPTFKPDDIQLVPDAWNRFERAVDTVSKSGPQHKTALSPSARFDILRKDISALSDALAHRPFWRPQTPD